MSRPSSPLAALLRRHHGPIVQEWARLNRDNLGTALPESELLNNIPDFVEALAVVLEAAGPGALVAAPLEIPRLHARLRREAAFSIEQVSREYALLRRVLVQTLGEALPGANVMEWERLHAALDAAIIESVTTYAHEATRVLETERQELREALEFRDRIMGIVSHDLRNPISAINLGAASLLRRPNLDDRQRSTLTRVLASAERANRLIHDLLDYTKARMGGGLPIEPRPARLDDIAQHVVDEAALASPGRSIHFEKAPVDYAGHFDADRVAQLMANLVSNALQHSLAESPVEARLDARPDALVFEVRNQGEPIPPELLPTLFEPFTQGARVTPGQGNVGLGLYISREIVEAHRGRIEVHSTAEEGTTFRVLLPREAPG